MTTAEPLVSVLMTAYNRELYITEAIESVLASSYTNFELIVVDDCSTDKTVSIARSFERKDKRIKIFVNEYNLGDYVNRNRAASYANGKYIKYLDSDDMIYRHSLTIMVESIELFPDACYAFLNYPNQDNKGPFPLVFSPEQAYHEHFFGGGFFYSGPGGTIIRKSIFDSVGGFSGSRMISDFELWLKMGATYPVLKIQPALIWWRMHEEQEYQIAHQNDMYIKLNYQVALNALKSNSCPLHEDLRITAIKNTRRLQSRRVLILLLKGKFKTSRDIMKFSMLHYPDILSCWIPVNRLKKILRKN